MSGETVNPSSRTPRLTICVPSRNRQVYFQETIRGLVSSLRTDVQFVFADNSDDPAVMQDFMADILRDPRVVFLPAAASTLSMMHNWERSVAAATGDWVCVIGDDDYVDPEVVTVIARAELALPEVDCVTWARPGYNWPENRPAPCNVMLRSGTGIHKVERDYLLRAMFHWEDADAAPNCPFCLYHGAISRHAITELKRRFGSVFEFPVVDYENATKMLFIARGFVYVERAFSILGACAQSNSASGGSADDAKRKYTLFMRDVGRNLDDDPEVRNFPFSSSIGLSAAVGQVQHWYKTRYGYRVTGWEKNFAKACEKTCLQARDLEAFERIRDAYAAAFRLWEGGRHARHFNPSWDPRREGAYRVFTGVRDGRIYIDENIAGVRTPKELYDVCSQIMVPIDRLEMTIPTAARLAPPPGAASRDALLPVKAQVSGKSRRR